LSGYILYSLLGDERLRLVRTKIEADEDPLNDLDKVAASEVLFADLLEIAKRWRLHD
jgi:hypothetical protein